MVTLSLTELVEKAKKGNEKAFMKLVEDIKGQMYKTAYMKLKNEEDALDAVQETLIRAFTNIKTLRENQFFKTWIIRILINECNNIYKYKTKVISLEENLTRNLQDEIAGSLEAIDLHNVLKKLENIHKEVIDLRYNYDLKFDDMAKVLDVPVGTVKSRLNRAHKILKNLLWDGPFNHSNKEVSK